MTVRKKTKIALLRTHDRAAGIRKVVDLLGTNPVRDRAVLLKPNFNTSDPFPGSTHNDTLTGLIAHLKEMGARQITVGDRSGPQDTGDVLQAKGIPDLCRGLGAGLINFDELPAGDWVRIKPDGGHWNNGFDIARPVAEADCVVATCCLKTHGFGGVFTMSLKLAVGMTHRRNMAELHSSLVSMRRMIAEINTAYAPSLILLDAIEAFTDGGPMRGTKKRADLLVAGTDRVAVDAVGLAILKDLGSNKAIMGTKIFEQQQMSRAVELGLGIGGPGEIEIVTGDRESEACAGRLTEILLQG
ncbi:MAG: DUF362 domain-containing protein [Thermodesulfovibrionales bacterium]